MCNFEYALVSGLFETIIGHLLVFCTNHWLEFCPEVGVVQPPCAHLKGVVAQVVA